MPRGAAVLSSKLVVGCDRRLTIEDPGNDKPLDTGQLIPSSAGVYRMLAISTIPRDLDRGTAGGRVVGTTGIQRKITLGDIHHQAHVRSREYSYSPRSVGHVHDTLKYS